MFFGGGSCSAGTESGPDLTAKIDCFKRQANISSRSFLLGARRLATKVPPMKSAHANLSRLEIPGLATFEAGEGGLLRLAINSPLASAHIYLHGAHVTHFQPKVAAPVLFMSRQSYFAPGKPIRGGVPLIFPWFGPRAGYPDAPAHGFARTNEWTVESLTVDGDQVVTAVFQLLANDATRAAWPHDFALRFRVTVGRTLTMTLETENTGSTPFTFEDALHTYFVVSDVRQTATTGLENTDYLDKNDGMMRKTQGPEPIRITQETDRLYENTRTTCALDDVGMKRRITVEKSGSNTSVVWNPWIAKAAAMPDFGDDEWPAMLCIETVNAGVNAIELAPGQTHSTRAVIGVD